MPTPAANWTAVELRWHFHNIDGTMPTGYIEVLPYVSRFTVESTNGLQVLAFPPMVAKLMSGSASVTVPASDDPDVSPHGFTYKITERIVGAPEVSYHIEVPESAALAGIDVSKVAPVTSSQGLPVSLVTRKEFEALKARVASDEAGGLGGGGSSAVSTVNGHVGDVVLTQDDVADGATDKQYSATDKTKLAGIASSATNNFSNATLLARVNHTGTQVSTTISDFAEAVEDTVATLLAAGTGVTLTYNDAGNLLTIDSVGSGVPNAEAVQDIIGAAIIGIGNITVAYNDGANTITVSTTATANSSDATLLNRANHTGTQDESTVVNLVTDLAAIIAAQRATDSSVLLKQDSIANYATLTAATAAVASGDLTNGELCTITDPLS